MKDLEQRTILGVGTFGRVKLVVHKPTDTPYALKCMRKGQVIALKQVEHVINEKKLLEECNHPFLLHLAATFQDDEEIYMLLELALADNAFGAGTTLVGPRAFKLVMASFKAVAPARTGLRQPIDVHRPHASGSPCARLPLAAPERGLRVRPAPPEREPMPDACRRG